jgi:hypothetical protein
VALHWIDGSPNLLLRQQWHKKSFDNTIYLVSITMPSLSKKIELVHCFRCHEDFNPSKSSKCIIEHDFDTFEGIRKESSRYTGTLNGKEKEIRIHLFRGEHEIYPNDVAYNRSSVVICTVEKCGKERHDASKAIYKLQIETKKLEREYRKKKPLECKEVCIKEIEKEDNQREAHRLRANMLGLDPLSDSLDSVIDQDLCSEFDDASDSSIVPLWLDVDDSDY